MFQPMVKSKGTTANCYLRNASSRQSSPVGASETFAGKTINFYDLANPFMCFQLYPFYEIVSMIKRMVQLNFGGKKKKKNLKDFILIFIIKLFYIFEGVFNVSNAQKFI